MHSVRNVVEIWRYPGLLALFQRLTEILAEMKAVCDPGEVKVFCLNQNCCLKENKKWKVWEMKWWLIHSCKLEGSSCSGGKDAVIMFPYPNPLPAQWTPSPEIFSPCALFLSVLYLLSTVVFRNNFFHDIYPLHKA